MSWVRLADQLGVAHNPVSVSNLGQARAAQQHLNPQSLQQAAAAQLAAYRQQQQWPEPKPYRFRGVDMDWKQFVDTLYPEDSPEKTWFSLRHRPE
jgi:hypothetical protein